MIFSKKFKENLEKQIKEFEKNPKNVEKSKKDFLSKIITDFLPLFVFIGVYKFSNDANPILPATLAMIIITVISLIVAYFLTKKIAKMPIISAAFLTIFGALTLFSGNELFIKIKPTLINIVFALILFFGYFSKKPLMSYLFAGELKFKNNKSWLDMSWRWAWFFVFLAILNEFIWRNFSTDFWVSFKVFGILPISILFMISQIPFMMKNVAK